MKGAFARTQYLGAGLLLALIVAGCTDRNNNGTPEVEVPKVEIPSTTEVTKTVENAATTVKKEAGPVVVKGVKAIDKAAKPVVRSAEEQLMTAKVKAAIVANQTVDSTQINIDVKNNAVILRGRVKNAREKATVQNLARKQAPNYKITNQLQIASAAKTS